MIDDNELEAACRDAAKAVAPVFEAMNWTWGVRDGLSVENYVPSEYDIARNFLDKALQVRDGEVLSVQGGRLRVSTSWLSDEDFERPDVIEFGLELGTVFDPEFHD